MLEEVELVVPLGSDAGCERFRSILLPSLRLFWQMARLVILFDDTTDGHRLADKCADYGTAVFVPPYGFGVWYEAQRLRFIVDKFSTAKYIGHVDDDTLFITPVTQEAIFHKGRPLIRGRYGPPASRWWGQVADSTEAILGHKEIARFMAYFPVVVRAEHIAAFRRFAMMRHNGTSVEEVLMHRLKGREWSDFNLLCNYLYYFHWDDYVWILQNGAPWHIITSGEPLWLSVAQHATWMPGGQQVARTRLAEGYCRASIADTPGCVELRKGSLHLDLFRFEDMQWVSHPGAVAAQTAHYHRVQALGFTLRLLNEPWINQLLENSSFAKDFHFTAGIHNEFADFFSHGNMYDMQERNPGLKEVIDFSQCFVGAGKVHGIRLVGRDLSKISVRIMESVPPWRMRASSECEFQTVVGTHLFCKLAIPMFARPGDCLGWAWWSGAIAFTDTLPESGPVIIRVGDWQWQPQEELYVTFAVSAVWHELPFFLELGN